MAKCNLLGRGEARYCKMLEKAKEKYTKLKVRMQELETAAEVKESEYLMSHKASKKAKFSKTLENSINSNYDVSPSSKYSSKEQRKQISTPQSGKDLSLNNDSRSVQFLNIENSNAAENKALNFGSGIKTTLSVDKEREFVSIDDDDSEFTKPLLQLPKHNFKDQDLDDVALRKPTLVKPEATMQGNCNLAESSRIDIDIEIPNISAAVMDDVTLLSNVNQVQPMINIRKESPLALSNSGGICFSGGLLGADGTNRFLGKWCKRGQNGESTSAKGSGNGDLIAVGADGRGGRIKALRSSNQTFSDGKENSLCSKRLKLGSKTNASQSKGCLQIEHFFGRVSQ
ncbi:hypothetical protein Lalb_Chr17g0339031 [Lupinus albus]|uniref:Uncharacterized protein n=1 Tax=Lupinus albus TaxID=3870 RepID=A0A6A4P201_LUPAL|nr:hypothetical protein Lalb_Chr17g0339031 [Lupinus albus]